MHFDLTFLFLNFVLVEGIVYLHFNEMDDKKLKQSENKDIVGVRIQNILNSLTKCKIDFVNEKEECKKIRDINSKLEMELKDTRELEKSHRYHLLSSREMIESLQETVSQLVHLKRDNKKLKDEMFSRDKTIVDLEKDKENLTQTHNENIKELRLAHERHIDELTNINEKKKRHTPNSRRLSADQEEIIQQVQRESETQIAQFTCVIEELRSKLKETETENSDKMNIVVLEYEEKLQRRSAQLVQLQEQLATQATKTDTNIDAYRRRLEELEENFKQSQFKQYLAQTPYSASQFETQAERPYSANAFDNSVNLNPVLGGSKQTPIPAQNKMLKQSTLPVMYYGDNFKPPASRIDKKGQFNITKKRKLYNANNEFQEF